MKKILAIAGLVSVLGFGTAFAVAGDSTSVSVSCSPASVPVNSATTCTATVTNTQSGGGSHVSPLGSVSFNFSGATGSFSGSPCTLSSATPTTSTCSVTFTPTSMTATNINGTYASSNTTGSGWQNSGPSSNFALTVTAALTAQTITVNTHAPASAVYNSTFPVAATAPGGTVAITTTGSCSIAGGTVTMTSGTGTCIVHYNQSGNGTYSAAPEVTESTTASAISLTPSVSLGTNKVYDATTVASTTACSFSSGVVGADAVTCSATSASFADANVGTGKTVVDTINGTLGGANASNYTLATTTAYTTADIAARPVTITADPQTKVAGNADPALTYSVTSGSLAGADAFSGALSRDPGETAGVYAINQNSVALSSNYTLSYVGANLTITPAPNTAPVATDVTDSTNEDTAKTITLTATDANSDPLTYAIVAGPSHGTLGTVSGNTVLYTPTANYNGADSFTFKANDGTVDSNTATVNLTVNAVNDVPSFTKGADETVSEDASAQTVSGWATSISAGPADESSQTVDFIVTNTNNAMFSVQPAISATGDLSYTPAPNANGSATVSVRIHDDGGVVNGGVDTSTTQTFTINVTAVNDAPVMDALTNTSVNELSTVTFNASTTDVDADTLAYSLSGAQVQTGMSINSSGAFSWTPTEAQGPGVYTFDVVVSDGNGGSATQPITLTVDEVNSTPTATGVSVSTYADDPVTVTLLGFDSDLPANTLTYSIASDPVNGTLGTVSGNQVTYTPTSGFAGGSDSFTFVVNDGTATSSPATVNITINASAPSLSAIADATTSELVALTFTASATDPDATDTLTYSLVGSSYGATIDGTTGDFSWTPTEAQGPGTYTFTVQVSDGIFVDSKSFVVGVTEANLAPVATDATYTTNEDTALVDAVAGTDADVPANTLTYATTSNPTHGTITAFDSTNGLFTYMPDQNYNGSDSFTFKVNDGTTDSAVDGTASITVTPVNDAPTISLNNRSEYYIVQDATFNDPGATASDIEDGNITANIVETGSVDTSALGDYQLTYTITDSGTDSTVSGPGLSASVIRNVHVYGVLGGQGSTNGVVGCRDPRATNYNPTASYDGSCSYGEVLGASTSTVPEGTSTPQLIVTTVTPTTGKVLGATAFTFAHDLKFGMYSTDVIELQKMLIAEGFLKVKGTTNYYGALTRAAVKLWQAKHGVKPVTGFFGPLSRAAANAATNQ